MTYRIYGALIASLGVGALILTPNETFADPVAVADDSPVFDRLIAFTGRDPAGRA